MGRGRPCHRLNWHQRPPRPPWGPRLSPFAEAASGTQSPPPLPGTPASSLLQTASKLEPDKVLSAQETETAWCRGHTAHTRLLDHALAASTGEQTPRGLGSPRDCRGKMWGTHMSGRHSLPAHSTAGHLLGQENLTVGREPLGHQGQNRPSYFHQTNST